MPSLLLTAFQISLGNIDSYVECLTKSPFTAAFLAFRRYEIICLGYTLSTTMICKMIAIHLISKYLFPYFFNKNITRIGLRRHFFVAGFTCINFNLSVKYLREFKKAQVNNFHC